MGWLKPVGEEITMLIEQAKIMEKILEVFMKQLETTPGQTVTGVMVLGVVIVAISIIARQAASRTFVTRSVLSQGVTRRQEKFDERMARVNTDIADIRKNLR